MVTIPNPTPQPLNINGTTYNLCAFYYNDKPDYWEHKYNAWCFGNFFPCNLTLTKGSHTASFHNTEAAFQATKWWDDDAIRAQFEAATTGNQAFNIKKSHKGSEDWSYAGFGDNLRAMRAILDIKYGQKDFANALLATKDAYLLEHNPVKGRDTFWSDDSDGDGPNHLGLMLMEIRKSLGGSGNPAVGVPIKEFSKTI